MGKDDVCTIWAQQLLLLPVFQQWDIVKAILHEVAGR
jgi:hypothetical protein